MPHALPTTTLQGLSEELPPKPLQGDDYTGKKIWGDDSSGDPFKFLTIMG